MALLILSCLWLFFLSFLLFFFWPPNWKSHLSSLISVPILSTAVLFHSQGLHNHFHLDRLNQRPPALLLFSDWIPTFPTTCGQPLPHCPPVYFVSLWKQKFNMPQIKASTSPLPVSLFFEVSRKTLILQIIAPKSQCFAICPSIPKQPLNHSCKFSNDTHLFC